MVVSIYEKEKIKRLDKYGIVIEELYPSNSGYLVRATDGRMNDKIYDKCLYQKRYFKDGKCIKVIDDFDSDMHYTIVDYSNEDEVVKCPNCGNSGNAFNFSDGCPYCMTVFNFGINNSNVLKKQVISGFALNLPKSFGGIYFKFNLIVIFIVVSFLLYGFIIKDLWITVFVVMLVVGFYPFALIGCYAYANNKTPVSYGGYKESRKSEWSNDFDEGVFLKNLYNELIILLFNNKSYDKLIDFNILSCKELCSSNDSVDVMIKIRQVFYDNDINYIDSCYNVKMVKNAHYNEFNEGAIIKCVGCGNSLKINDKKCSYCDRINNAKNEWILSDFKKVDNL